METFATTPTNVPNSKPRRKKNPQPKGASRDSSLRTLRPSKRALKADFAPISQEIDGSAHDSLPDPSMSMEYRSLRRRYLILEEESFDLDRELDEVDVTIKSLEDEKFALLDKLVILEGLVDPSDIHPKGGQ